jgi:hypothetical protein
MTIKEITRIREAIPMGLRDFAEAIGVNYMTLWRWGTGSTPNAKTLRKIEPRILKLAAKHGVSVEPVQGNGVTAPAAPKAKTAAPAKRTKKPAALARA